MWCYLTTGDLLFSPCLNFQSKEARRLKEFLEDYDDERDDPKYYK